MECHNFASIYVLPTSSSVSQTFVHLSQTLPYLFINKPRATGEQKSKPTQASVRELRGLGISPDLVMYLSSTCNQQFVLLPLSGEGSLTKLLLNLEHFLHTVWLIVTLHEIKQTEMNSGFMYFYCIIIYIRSLYISLSRLNILVV